MVDDPPGGGTPHLRHHLGGRHNQWSRAIHIHPLLETVAKPSFATEKAHHPGARGYLLQKSRGHLQQIIVGRGPRFRPNLSQQRLAYHRECMYVPRGEIEFVIL